MRSGSYQPNKRDANERPIIDALEAVGATVRQIDEVDLLVGFRGANFLLEVKDPAKPPSARGLTRRQQALDEEWRGQWVVVMTVDEALRAIGASGGPRRNV